MQTGAPLPWLFLDFDGVLCDSLEECFRSSWLALKGYQAGDELPLEIPVPADYRIRFRAARPYIRSGEDYLLLHQLLAEGRDPGSQKDFDKAQERAGKPVMDDYRSRIYAVRDDLLANHRQTWLGWNPLFAGVGAMLRQLGCGNVWILSTKKASFIAGILVHHGVDWPVDRIVCSGDRKKLDWIADIAHGAPSVLLDDQIDHLDFQHASCRCLLARWGYVLPGENAQSVPGVDLPELPGFLRPWLSLPQVPDASAEPFHRG